MTTTVSNPSSNKRMSIHFMFAFFSVVVLISFGCIAAVTVRGLGTLAVALAGMDAMYRGLSSQSSMMEIHAWEAQNELLDAAYEASIGALRDEVERHVGLMEKALADARGIMVPLLSLEELRPDQFEPLDEIYASFEAYASPFAAVNLAFKAGAMPAPGDVGAIDNSFSDLAYSLEDMNTALRGDAERRNAESKIAVSESNMAIAAGTAGIQSAVQETIRLTAANAAALDDVMSSAEHFVL